MAVHKQLTVSQFLERGAAFGIQVGWDDEAHNSWDEVRHHVDSKTSFKRFTDIKKSL